jgi:excisionase family DNA binding protein
MTPFIDSNKAYLTPNEVAELLMVAPVTVRSWAQKGLLVAKVTPGGHRRFLKSDVERYCVVA